MLFCVYFIIIFLICCSCFVERVSYESFFWGICCGSLFCFSPWVVSVLWFPMDDFTFSFPSGLWFLLEDIHSCTSPLSNTISFPIKKKKFYKIILVVYNTKIVIG